MTDDGQPRAAEPQWRCTETDEAGRQCRKGNAMPHYHVFETPEAVRPGPFRVGESPGTHEQTLYFDPKGGVKTGDLWAVGRTPELTARMASMLNMAAKPHMDAAVVMCNELAALLGERGDLCNDHWANQVLGRVHARWLSLRSSISATSEVVQDAPTGGGGET